MNFVTRIDNYVDKNFNVVLRFSSLIYILIEAAALATVNIDNNEYKDIITYTEFFKSIYLTWVEFIFGVLFIKTVQRARTDGILDLVEVLKIIISLIMVVSATLMIAYLMMISAGWIDLKSVLVANGFNILEETVVRPAHVTTFMVIMLSLVVNIVTAIAFGEEPKKEDKKEDKKVDNKKDDKKDDKKKEDKKEEDRKENPPASPPAVIDAFLKDTWQRNKEGLMALITSLTSGKWDHIIQISKTRFQGDAINKLVTKDYEHIFNFIKDGSVGEQTIRAVLALELYEIFPATHISNDKYKDIVSKMGEHLT